MATVGHLAQEHRVRRRLVGQAFRLTQQHLAVGDHHLVARVQPQQRRVRPAGGSGVDVGAHLVGPIGADARQQRHGLQLEIHDAPF